MRIEMTRRSFLAASSCAVVMALGLSACGSNEKENAIRIGTMPNEHILPMWVAEAEGLFDEAGVDAEIIVFDSAQNLSAAITAGEVDIAMTDPMRAVKLAESGTDLSMEWITLSSGPGQACFGILASPESGISSLAGLVGTTKGVGVAANTVPEYVFDKLCEQQGIDPSSILTSEVPSMPDRYGLTAAGQLDAGAFPGSLLALGEASGLILLADDSGEGNLSQSVMVVRDSYNTGAGAETLDIVRRVWDRAVALINEHPEEYRALLIEKANLNDKVADTYPIAVYPFALDSDGSPAYPPAELIEPQIAWMKAKGYSTKNVVYNGSDGSISIS